MTAPIIQLVKNKVPPRLEVADLSRREVDPCKAIIGLLHSMVTANRAGKGALKTLLDARLTRGQQFGTDEPAVSDKLNAAIAAIPVSATGAKCAV